MPSVKSIISSALTVLLVLLIAAVIISGLVVRANTARQNDINVRLENRLEELKKENSILYIRTSSAYDLSELEDKAINELGMVYPYAQKTKEISTGVKDKAEILTESYEGSWISSFRNILNFD